MSRGHGSGGQFFTVMVWLPVNWSRGQFVEDSG
jgi:hypothetical protein